MFSCETNFITHEAADKEEEQTVFEASVNFPIINSLFSFLFILSLHFLILIFC